MVVVMFERFTELARRVLFFARYEAMHLGSPAIETHHVVLGLLREPDRVLRSLLPARSDITALREEIAVLKPARDGSGGSADLPLAATTRHTLVHAAADAKGLRHKHIGTEHILLALVREPGSFAGALLARHGVTRERVLNEIARQPFEPGAPAARDRASLHMLVDTLPPVQLEQALRALHFLQSEVAEEQVERLVEFVEQRKAEPPPVGMGGGWRTYSFSREEDGAQVIETHRFYHGHEVLLIERLSLNQEGSTLTYAQEIKGPKKELQHTIDFDVC